MDLTPDRVSDMDLQRDKHRKVAALHSTIVDTVRELIARRALMKDTEPLFRELEVLLTVEARERDQ